MSNASSLSPHQVLAPIRRVRGVREGQLPGSRGLLWSAQLCSAPSGVPRSAEEAWRAQAPGQGFRVCTTGPVRPVCVSLQYLNIALCWDLGAAR